jgi:hypothetical protein
MQASHISTTSTVLPGQLMLIMTIGPRPDACRTQWIRDFTAPERAGSGFMAFQLARRTRTVLLAVPV